MGIRLSEAMRVILRRSFGTKPMQVRCPQCHKPMDLADDSHLGDLTCPSCGSGFSLLGDETLTHDPGQTKTIGHFELLNNIGMGSFGTSRSC